MHILKYFKAQFASSGDIIAATESIKEDSATS